MTSTFEWQFGGWLRALPASTAWGLMLLFAFVGVGGVVWLYRCTLRDLPRVARAVLTVLRVAIVLLVLLCLANPSRVERSQPDSAGRDTLAVVVDRSASMSTPDYRGATRLADAVRTWKLHEAESRVAFPKISFQKFALQPTPAEDLEDAVKSGSPGNETHLYATLRETLGASPAAIVCLTDGLDTTADKVEDLADEALRRGVPLYFVTGKNRARASDILSIREIKAPASVLRQAQFTATALIEAGAGRDGDLPVQLWSGKAKLAEARLPLRAGRNTLAWPVPMLAPEACSLPLEFRVGEGTNQEIAACSTRVVNQAKIEILYYQGALQWGYRFLRSTLQSDPSFQMTGILNPALGMHLPVALGGERPPVDLPENANELKRYQIVVLAHVFADQLTLKQQKALVEYAKNGGGVLFVAPDSESAKRFSGTQLEQMLPIVFNRPQYESPNSSAEREFQQRMQALGGSRNEEETLFANRVLSQQQDSDLISFAAPPGKSAVSKLFQSGSNAPQFSDYTEVQGVKAGAEVLAVHPLKRIPGTNAPCVLVARQQFGQGFTAALTTDLLWRWKMSLPSTSHTVEIFWQQFLLSLAQSVPGQGLRLVRTGDTPVLNRPVTVQVEGPSDSIPEVFALSPQGERRTIASEPVGTEGSVRVARFLPDVKGRWEVIATNKAHDSARITMNLFEQARTMETINLPPDVDGLRRLAETTGGALIESDAAAFRSRAENVSWTSTKHVQLWNSAWLLALLLGVYCVELITRRLFRLL